MGRKRKDTVIVNIRIDDPTFEWLQRRPAYRQIFVTLSWNSKNFATQKIVLNK